MCLCRHTAGKDRAVFNGYGYEPELKLKPEHQPKLRFIYGFGRGLFILSERDNKLFFVLGIDVDVDFVFAGEPAESSVKLFVFELG